MDGYCSYLASKRQRNTLHSMYYSTDENRRRLINVIKDGANLREIESFLNLTEFVVVVRRLLGRGQLTVQVVACVADGHFKLFFKKKYFYLGKCLKII